MKILQQAATKILLFPAASRASRTGKNMEKLAEESPLYLLIAIPSIDSGAALTGYKMRYVQSSLPGRVAMTWGLGGESADAEVSKGILRSRWEF